MRGAGLTLVGLIASVIAVFQVWREIQRPIRCDTTYIYEGYEQVPLAPELKASFPRYKLLRYVDQDGSLQPELADLQSRHRVPVLFVHGHFGSPQQMRSMASESAREVVLRLRQAGTWQYWLDWQAVDFQGEPSAFEPRLQNEQSKFVAACICQLVRSTPRAMGPIVLVGYSMGGLVLEDALSTLIDPQSAPVNMSTIALVLTLGSPGQFLPTFLPPMKSYTDQMAVNQPPTVHVLAGPGDVQVPRLAAWSSGPRSTSGTRRYPIGGPQTRCLPTNLTATLEVDMDDVPGVWTTTGHKGMVSCNQLVRQTVPMIADAVAIAGERGHTSNAKAAMKMAALKLTTHAACSFMADGQDVAMAVKDIEAALPIWKPRREANLTTTACEAMTQRIISQHILPDQTVACRTWRAVDYDVKQGRLVLYFKGIIAGEDIKIWATPAWRANGTIEVSSLALPLPDMVATTSPPAIKRPWYEIVAGVDWQENSTRVLQLPFGTDSHVFSEIKLEIIVGLSRNDSRSSTKGMQPMTFLAQVTDHFDALNSQQSMPIPSSPWHGSSVLERNHSAVLELAVKRLEASGGVRFVSQILVGREPLYRVSVTRNGECKGSEVVGAIPEHEPVLVAIDSDQVQYLGDTIRTGRVGMQLWHPAVAQRRIILFSDPRCSYALRTSWDLVPWMAYTLRYHVYAVVPLALALAIEHLGGAPVLTGPALPLAAALLPVASAWPEKTILQAGSSPRLPLSMIEVGFLFLVAWAVFNVLQSLMHGFLKVVQRLRMLPSCQNRTSMSLVDAIVMLLLLVVTSILHPGLPPITGWMVLIAAVAVAEPMTRGEPEQVDFDWIVYHMIIAMPSLLWVYGWMECGRSFKYQVFTVERCLALLPALHSFTLSLLLLRNNRDAPPISRRPAPWLCFGTATVVGVRGLWGSTSSMVYGAAILSACDFASIITRWRHITGNKRD